MDSEGKKQGIENNLLITLSEYYESTVTYAGGVRDVKDIQKIKELGKSRVHFTVGSALDIFGGDLAYQLVLRKLK